MTARPPVNLGHVLSAAHILIMRARDGDKRALKELMFPYHYGTVRDRETGQLRSHTEEEREAAYRRIMGTVSTDA